MKHFTNLLSIYFGKFAEIEFPSGLQSVINTLYVRTLGLDMNEFKKPYKYRTLNALFTRELETPREISSESDALISPCDALVTVGEDIHDLDVYQVKGVSYSLKDLLTGVDKESVYALNNGNYINLYLSPKDYHRYHAPLDLKVEKLVYVPAKLYPVNNPALKYIKNLFCQNERVILQCSVNEKVFIIVLVGALNVGKMVVNFEKVLETNSGVDEIFEKSYEDLVLKKGEEFGYFKMGSTVLLFAEEDMLDLDVEPGTKVKFGERIASLQ